MTTRPLLSGLLALLPLAALAQTAPPSPNEAKLRDALRTTTTQLRQAQEETAGLTSKLESKTAELAALAKKTKAEAAKLTAELETTAAKLKEQTALTERTAGKARELDALAAKWKAEAEALDAKLRATESERARLKVVSDRLTTRITHRETQNVELVKLAGEILTRFEQYGLGEAIAGKDTFIGVKRVALRNYVQDHADAIAAAKVIPGTPAPAENAPAATAAR